ncbi:MAG: hypothetical protein R2793_09465 [Flavobacteriaceae bacterium]
MKIRIGNNMMKSFFFGLLLCVYSSLHAQGTVTVKNGTLNSRSNYSNMISYYNVKDGDVIILNHNTIGSPYVADEYQLGKIYLNNEEIISTIYLKYNAYNDIFLAKPSLNTSDEEAQGVTKAPNLKIKMGSQIFESMPSTANPYEWQYYEILTEGTNFTLCKKYEKIYNERVQATTSLTRDIPASFKEKITYYVLDANNQFIELPNSKKKILDVFGDKKKEMATLVKANKLNLNKEQDLISLFKLYEAP